MAAPQETRVVTTEELNDGLNMGSSLQVVNVLGPKFASLGMIRYSRRIPLEELARRCGEIDKGREVVTYCSDSASRACLLAAELLKEQGYKVSVYRGGLAEWSAAGLPMDMPAA